MKYKNVLLVIFCSSYIELMGEAVYMFYVIQEKMSLPSVDVICSRSSKSVSSADSKLGLTMVRPSFQPVPALRVLDLPALGLTGLVCSHRL